MRTRIALVAVGVALGSAACAEILNGPQPGWFRASVAELEPQVAATPPASYTVEGDGWFSIGRDPETHRPVRFSIGTGRTTEDKTERQSITLVIGVPEIPRPGRYSVVLPTPSGAAPAADFSVFFNRKQLPSPDGQPREGWDDIAYVATEGWVEITRATGGVVEGTFHLVGVQHLLTVLERDGAQNFQARIVREDPLHIPATDAPRVEVTGSFRARPLSSIPIMID
jgi:hypothetical protein